MLSEPKLKCGRNEEQNAERLLRALLRDGPKSVDSLKRAAKAAEIGWRTMEEAKSALGVQSQRPSGSRGWVWSFDDDALDF